MLAAVHSMLIPYPFWSVHRQGMHSACKDHASYNRVSAGKCRMHMKDCKIPQQAAQGCTWVAYGRNILHCCTTCSFQTLRMC